MADHAAHLAEKSFRSRMTRRQKIEAITAGLFDARATFEGHYRDLSEYYKPRRFRMSTSEVNQGGKKNHKIIDSTASTALRTARSGLMSGVTSPARRWYVLETQDIRLMSMPAAKGWLYEYQERMAKVFNRSNLYRVLPTIYDDMLIFGTAAMYVEFSPTKTIRCQSFIPGTFWIGRDAEGMADTFYREFSMTVAQIVDTFAYRAEDDEIDWSVVSEHVKTSYEQGQHGTRYDVCHMIYPNELFDPNRADAKFKKYASVYYEKGFGTQRGHGRQYPPDKSRYLRESGYDLFPVLVFDWERAGEDDYATSCPGMEALGDVKQLQEMEKKSLRAINKMIDPSMKASTSLRNKPVNLAPGGVTWIDDMSSRGTFEPAHQVVFPIREVEVKQAEARTRIRDVFMENLWLMFTMRQPEAPPTATQVQIQNDEKLLVLGPVLEQINQELERLIAITGRHMQQQGLVPEPPRELQGSRLNVVFVSVVAQAQKLVTIANLDRFLTTAVQLASVNPEVLDTIDTDQIIFRYADRLSVDPGLVRTIDQIQQLRQARAQQAAQMQRTEHAAVGARAAKDLSAVDTEGSNVVAQLFRQAAA